MAAVANVTELANSVNPTDEIERALISPALVKNVCMMNLMSTVDLPSRTLTKKIRKRGSLSAAAILAEATALAINAELTDTSADLVIQKAALVSAISVEQAQFGDINEARMLEEHGKDIARFVDNESLALFSSLSTVVTATDVLTVADLELAVFNINSSECPDKEMGYVHHLGHNGLYALRAEIRAAGAANYTNMEFLNILGGQPQSNCFSGNIPGIGDIYSSSGHATGGGDDTQASFHPKWAFAGAFAPSPVTWSSNKGSEGFYSEQATYYFYDVVELNDGCGVGVKSDS